MVNDNPVYAILMTLLRQSFSAEWFFESRLNVKRGIYWLRLQTNTFMGWWKNFGPVHIIWILFLFIMILYCIGAGLSWKKKLFCYNLNYSTWQVLITVCNILKYLREQWSMANMDFFSNFSLAGKTQTSKADLDLYNFEEPTAQLSRYVLTSPRSLEVR